MMGGLRKSWPLIIVVILISSCISEARHHLHKPSAVVVGVVFCETCFQDNMSKGSHYITGATVAVKCEEGSTRPAFYQEIKTDKQGKFKVKLPFSVSKHIKNIEGCTVKLVKSSEPNCAVASTATSSLIHLKGKKGKQHIFSAGFFTFKPLKQPGLCNQQPSVTQSQLHNSLGIVQQPEQLFPPIIPPILPSPQGPLPIPNPLQPPPLLPNPLQPPAPPLIPNPLQPPATPAPLIPNPFQPPSPPPTLLPPLPPLPNLPPVPVLTPPSPPPPPPPRSLIPGIPLPPIIPGVPPLKPEKVDP